MCRVFKKSLVGVVASSASASAAVKKGAMGMEDTIGTSSMAAVGTTQLPPLLDMSGSGFVDPAAAHVTCFSNNALEAAGGHGHGHGHFFNSATADDHHHGGLGAASSSSTPFLANYAQYGLVQLLESSSGYRGLDMAAPCKQQQQPAAAACKEMLMSASQDTGLTSDVHPEISSSSGGAQKFDHEPALWGY